MQPERWPPLLLLSRGARARFGADPRSLALVRVLLALLVLADLAMRARDLRFFYTDDGVFPRSVAREILGPRDLSLHLLSGSTGFVALLFLLAGLAALALLVGWHTKVATVASWLLLLSLQNRNTNLPNSGDFLLRLLLFWAMFLPLGARASVDRAGDPPDDRPVLSAGWAGFAFQALIVYVSCALFKGPQWMEGTAVYYSLRTDYFVRPAGTLLLGFPALLPYLTWSAYAIEALGPLLLICPLWGGRIRALGVLLFASFHLALCLCLRLGLFPFVSITSVAAFLPSWFWERLDGPRARRLLARLDLLLRGLRGRLGGAAPPRGPGALVTLGNGLAAVCLTYVAFSNLSQHAPAYGPPPAFRPAGDLLKLDQRWQMFAGPKHEVGWHVFAGLLADGRIVDLLRGGAPCDDRKPERIQALYPTQSRFMYTFFLIEPKKGHVPQLTRYAEVLCRDWNASHHGPESLRSVELAFMIARTLPAMGTAPVQKLSAWRQPCPATATPPAPPSDLR